MIFGGEMPAADTSNNLRNYSIALAALIAALALRWLLVPFIGESLPLVTLFGAVACAVFVGGLWPALLVAVLGYLAAAWALIEPRAAFPPVSKANVVGFLAYMFTCAVRCASARETPWTASCGSSSAWSTICSTSTASRAIAWSCVNPTWSWRPSSRRPSKPASR